MSWMDDVVSGRNQEENLMKDKIEALIKKYNITPFGDKIRVERIKDADNDELNQIKDMKQEILQYFQDQEKNKKKKEKEIIEKAKREEDGLFLVVEYDFEYGVYILAARRLNKEEKERYSKWFSESGFASVGSRIILKQVDYNDLPKRKPDGTFLGGSNIAWIITPEEYDGYIQKNQAREKEVQEKEAEGYLEEKKERYQKEKATLLSCVDDWTISEQNIQDEDGGTKLYRHCFLIKGEKLSFTERNVFDFGVVINPDYEIVPGISGGIAIEKDGLLQWHTFSGNVGWTPVRTLTDHEKICWTLVAKYGEFAGSGIRM